MNRERGNYKDLLANHCMQCVGPTWVAFGTACLRTYELVCLANISETSRPIVVKLWLQICDNNIIDFRTVFDF